MPERKRSEEAGPQSSPSGSARPVDPALAEVKFLTVAEVATLMRVSKMTVYRMVHGGDLPAVRVGRSFRVPEKAVHDYLRGAFIEAG
jgi:excisionase family DNA binding protein